MSDNLTFLQTCLLLETLAAQAWPAAEIEELDGWQLRFTHNVSRRANSVWPNGDNGRYTLTDKLSRVEAFYAQHSLPARYQITPAAQPANLDAILADRGYVTDAPTHVQTAVLTTVIDQTRAAHAVTLTPRPTADWLAFYHTSGGFSDHQAAVRRGILQRIRPPIAFAAAQENGRFLGIGVGVCAQGWLGIFGMLTASQARRRGVATAVLHTLAQWGTQQGAAHAYLQVMSNNSAALPLYQRAGFTTRYNYHYRQKQQ